MVFTILIVFSYVHEPLCVFFLPLLTPHLLFYLQLASILQSEVLKYGHTFHFQPLDTCT